MTPPEPVSLRREAPIAALLAACVALAALWHALWLAPTHTLGAWDWAAQASSLTSVSPPPRIAHTEILDPVRQMIPWALTAREQLARGEAPLWSPYNGGSALLANYQSALLSPFTWPFYVLPLGAALLVSAFAKLFALAFGMFLFLRELSFSRTAAATSAVAFGTAGFHLMCMLHPHVGVLACLPPALIAIERAAKRRRRNPQQLPFAAMAALALALGAMSIAGHPETLLFCLYVVTAFTALRVVQSGRGEGAFDSARAARFGAAFVLAGVVGALIGAVQLAPFLELFSSSRLAHDAGRSIARFSPFHALLLFFPDAAGHPASGPTAGPLLAANYQEVNSMHIGSLVAALAIASPIVLRRSATGWFFLVLGVLALASVFDLAPLNGLNDALFFSSYMPSTRANPLWMVGASVCAACVVDAVVDARPSRLFVVVGLAAAALTGARFALPAWWNSVGDGATDAIGAATAIAAQRSDVLLALTFVGLVALALLRYARRGFARAAAVGALLASVAAQGVYAFGDFMPVVEDRFVLPRTDALDALRERTRGERVVFLTNDSLPVNTNALYQTRMLASYEMLEERRWTQLREELLGVTSHMSGTRYASRRALDLFGVRSVVTRGAWLPIDTENCFGALETQSRWVLMAEFGVPPRPRTTRLDAERTSLTQRLRPSRDGLSALALVFRDAPDALGSSIELELRDGTGDAVLARRTLKFEALRPLPNARRECVFGFDPIARSSEHEYELTVRLVDAERAAGVELLRAGKLSATVSGDAEDEADEKPRRGGARVVFDLGYELADFGAPAALGSLLLRSYEAGAGEAWLVSRAVSANDELAAHELVLSESFDPRQEVVLEGLPAAGERSTPRELAIEDDRPARTRYRTDCAAPTFLVLAQPYVAGWRARIDGRAVDVLRANFAFCAVAIPAGRHAVEFEYSPASIRWGALASLLALLMALGVGGSALRRSA